MKLSICLLSLLFIAFAFSLGDEVIDYLDVMKIGNPLTYKNLKIFPIKLTKIMDREQYLSLDEGLKKKYLKIKEVGSGQVNQVLVKNTSKYKIYIMTGEVIVGAKQDRMLKEDVLLPANSGWISLAVYCTEHGRWNEVSKEFKAKDLMAPGALRQRAKASESQAEVWDEIAGTQSRLKVAAPTQALQDVFEDEEIKKQSKAYIGKFTNLPNLSSSTIGVVVTVSNRIVCADIFANHSLLKKLWSKLLKSYVLDAIQANEDASVSKGDIEDFIDTLEDADFDKETTPGLGRLLKIDTDEGFGSALVYKNSVIHLDLFPKIGSVEPHQGLNLDFRRQERND